MAILQTQKSRDGLAKVTAAATDPTSIKGIVVHKLTFATGQRVSLGDAAGYVRETNPATDSVLVEFDKPIPGQFTRHAFVWASDLELVDAAPLEAHDAANGALWPRSLRELGEFAQDLGLMASDLVFALERLSARRPDYQQMEAAALADPASEPAGDDE